MSGSLSFLAGAAAVLALWCAGGCAAFAADEPPFPIDRAPAPLFEDPVWHGATDPTVLWNPIAKEFTIYYTQLRATLKNPNGVEWAHGTAIGIATSKDGVKWKYEGICTGDEGLGTPIESKLTWWAPSVLFHEGTLHMFVSRVDGIYSGFGGKRNILHFTSSDGRKWKYQMTLPLSSENCIDPCIYQIGAMWYVCYKDEVNGHFTHVAESPDLKTWKVRGKVVSDVPHEGPLVWRWKGAYWMIVDAGARLRIYRSVSGIDAWEYHTTILQTPGKRAKDCVPGYHAGMLVQGERAFVFYSVHYNRDNEAAIQVAELEMDAAGMIVCDRDRYATQAQALPEGAVITNSLGMKLVRIPAGEFQMGSGESAVDLAKAYDPEGKSIQPEYFANEQPQHRVRITRPFYLGQNPVTLGEFLTFHKAANYQMEAERDGGKGDFGKLENGQLGYSASFRPWAPGGKMPTENDPVVWVSWNDAMAFCEWLGKKEGKEYRLPTEAQWEYACRAGSTTRYYFGDRVSELTDYAWYSPVRTDDNWGTHPVGGRKPNTWGLYDMCGNAWQWCADWYGKDYYANPPADDPKGPDSGTERVMRGGGWSGDARHCRSANRFAVVPSGRHSNIGFRISLSDNK